MRVRAEGNRTLDNSIFYTFSTIAQVVAGISAVVTALCIFRLQSLESELRARVERVNSDNAVDTMALSRRVRAEHHIVSRDLGLRLKRVKVIDPSGAAYNFLRLKWMIWAIAYGQWLIVVTLALSMVTIVGSIGVLATVEYSIDTLIPRFFSSKSELLWFGVALCAFTLFFNGLTLVRVFRNR